jgi:hypothetical protein
MAATREWTTVDEEQLEFLFGGPSPPPEDATTRPWWYSKLED